MKDFEAIAKELKHRGIDAEVVTVHKSNGDKQGISIRDEDSASPVIYEELLTGNTVEELADEVINLHNKYKHLGPAKEEIMNREFALANAIPTVCRRDWNSFDDVAHRPLGNTDLEICIRVVLENASFKVTESYLNETALTWEELYNAALKNAEFKIRNIAEIIAEMAGVDVEDIPPAPMNVITNKYDMYGAAGICDTEMLKEAMRKLECDAIYVIPSSIHEVMCLSSNDTTSEAVTKIIQTVNEESVKEADRLSDHVYIFDGIEVRNG